MKGSDVYDGTPLIDHLEETSVAIVRGSVLPQGRVTIPFGIRELLHIEKGDVIEWRRVPGSRDLLLRLTKPEPDE
jgi:bifunctional DNA-binding transcriptional regulator/antitoxin component of YhaV-PrlF toxin-antitoxin module